MHENQKVLIPGDPERDMETSRLQKGIPLVASVVADLEQVGKQFGVLLK
jgi:LDH2 family malate/lactate/ureidoglycolate dehydrogenase